MLRPASLREHSGPMRFVRAYAFMALGVLGGCALRFGLEATNVTPVQPYRCFDWVSPVIVALVVFAPLAPLVVASSKWRSNLLVLLSMAAVGLVLTSSTATYAAATPCSPL